jgi:hypothetical protein
MLHIPIARRCYDPSRLLHDVSKRHARHVGNEIAIISIFSRSRARNCRLSIGWVLLKRITRVLYSLCCDRVDDWAIRHQAKRWMIHHASRVDSSRLYRVCLVRIGKRIAKHVCPRSIWCVSLQLARKGIHRKCCRDVLTCRLGG